MNKFQKVIAQMAKDDIQNPKYKQHSFRFYRQMNRTICKKAPFELVLGFKDFNK